MRRSELWSSRLCGPSNVTQDSNARARYSSWLASSEINHPPGVFVLPPLFELGALRRNHNTNRCVRVFISINLLSFSCTPAFVSTNLSHDRSAVNRERPEFIRISRFFGFWAATGTGRGLFR